MTSRRESTLDRRAFLATAAAGSAALLHGCHLAGTRRGITNGWTPPSADQRRALVEAARFGRKQPVTSSKGLAICTHPLASSAAADMLALGGNACDAILAASIAQTVVEPHMTTLSGCLSMLYYDAGRNEYSYVNGMMAAPRGAPFLREPDFETLMDRTRDGTLCFVPGFWGGFEAAHDRHGALPRKTVMAPAIHYARSGFEIHPFLWGEMFIESATLGAVAESREVFFRDGALLEPGDLLVHSRYADTLDRLADEGGDHFYRGEFGRRYAQAVSSAGGHVSPADMAGYQAFWDEPARGTYRDWGVVASPAPDFGGQAFIEIMNMVELIDLARQGPAFESADTAHTMMQIIGLVYADAVGGRFSGDLPSVEKALSKEYAAERFAALSGAPDRPGAFPPPPGSTHVTVVDQHGNVATLLHSVMSMPFTTGLWVDGVYACASGVHLGSGLIESGGRAHARICPNMFTSGGKPVLASGSPSVSLTENIVQNSVNLLDFGIPIETAVHHPRFGGSSMTVEGASMVEADMGEGLIARLRDSGTAVEVVNPWNWTCGSFEGIQIREDGAATACPDPRRTACAVAPRSVRRRR